MPSIHAVATITSKGQITLPKPIRQALGVGVGGKVAFDLRGCSSRTPTCNCSMRWRN
jgi:antitoxin PrlF